MRSFNLPGYRLDVVSHSRVFNPERFVGGVSEAFEVDCYDVSGREPVPFDWYPNADPHPHPDRPQRMVFIWTGKQFQDVYAGFDPTTDTRLSDEEARQKQERGEPVEYRKVDVKRGGDFRGRFWGSVVRRIRKAEAAARLGVVVGDVPDNELDESAFTEPVNLRGRALNDAVRDLTGEDARIATRKPRGTVENIDCDFNSHAISNGTESEDDTQHTVGITSTGEFRSQFRFPLSSLSGTVNDSDWQFNQLTQFSVEAGDEYQHRDYGTSDPDTDDAATKFSNSGSGTIYAVSTGHNTTGSKTVDLGATADGDIESRIGSPGFFTIAVDPGTGVASTETINIEGIRYVGNDPATLIVDYTAAEPETAVQDPIGPGIVAFAR